MKQEDKDLLFRDLCARLPYGVICHDEVQNNDDVLKQIEIEGFGRIRTGRGLRFIEYIKPYLRPMSSMTEEEKEQYLSTKVKIRSINREGHVSAVDYYDTVNTYDWLYSHHFDIRNLIDKDFALEAPEGLY